MTNTAVCCVIRDERDSDVVRALMPKNEALEVIDAHGFRRNNKNPVDVRGSFGQSDEEGVEGRQILPSWLVVVFSLSTLMFLFWMKKRQFHQRGIHKKQESDIV